MKRGLICALLATMWMACSKDQTVSDEMLDKKTIYASIEETVSRVELNEQKQTVWTAGDEIIVYNPTRAEHYTFTGKTGDRNGTFQLNGWYNIGSGYFDSYYAVYHTNKSPLFGFVGDTPAIIFGSQATQSYRPSSYGVYANAMVGTSSDGTNFAFRNLFGYLRLSLKGDKIVTKIELKGALDEPLAGDSYFVVNDPTTLYWYQKTATTLTLDCGDGVVLTDQPTEFYFAMPPVTFEKGFTAIVYFSDESMHPVSTSKRVAIERNAIQPMAAVEVGSGIEWQVVTINHQNSQIAAPIVLSASDTSAAGYIEWGDGATSLLGAVTSYDYTDNAASHTVVVKAQNAASFAITGVKGVQKIDLSNF